MLHVLFQIELDNNCVIPSSTIDVTGIFKLSCQPGPEASLIEDLRAVDGPSHPLTSHHAWFTCTLLEAVPTPRPPYLPGDWLLEVLYAPVCLISMRHT